MGGVVEGFWLFDFGDQHQLQWVPIYAVL